MKSIFPLLTEQSFLELITHSFSVLNLPEQAIFEKYKGIPVFHILYLNGVERVHQLEIRLEEHKTTLICEMDGFAQCKYSFLFFDNLDNNPQNMPDYRKYMEKYFDYESNNNKWMVSNYSMSIKHYKNDVYFMFSMI